MEVLANLSNVRERLDSDAAMSPAIEMLFDEALVKLARVINDLPTELTMNVSIVAITQDMTKNTGSAFWRCRTREGIPVNVFKSDDPLKDTYSHFKRAEWHHVLDALTYGETSNFMASPIRVIIRQDGKFWQVGSVRPREPGEGADIPFDDDGALG